MPKFTKQLTDRAIKEAKTREKAYKMADSKGLYLLVQANGSKLWRMDFTLNGKRQTISFGSYPDVKLAAARSRAYETKEDIVRGIDPMAERKTARDQLKESKAKEIIEDKTKLHLIVTEWLALKERKIKYVTVRGIRLRVEKYLIPRFGDQPIGDIKEDDIREFLTAISQTNPPTALKMLSYVHQIWDYAKEDKRLSVCSINVKRSRLKNGHDERHLPAIVKREQLKDLLLAIDRAPGIAGFALKLVTIFPYRAKNLTALEWDQVDFDRGVITIPRDNMKNQNKNLADFSLPIPSQAIAILRDCQKFRMNKWVFPSPVRLNAHISSASPRVSLNKMGYQGIQSLHGFRTTYRSNMDTYATEHGVSYEAKEAVLDHTVGSVVSMAYKYQSDYTEQMRPLLQWWADYLDEVRSK